MDKNPVCKSCQNLISTTYFFCPYCGKKLKEPLLATSFGRQLGMYFTAVFFPIIAIAPGLRYINQREEKSKAVGTIILLIAGITLMVEVYLAFEFYQQFGKYLNSSLFVDSSGWN